MSTGGIQEENTEKLEYVEILYCYLGLDFGNVKCQK